MIPWYEKAFGRLYPIVYAHRNDEEAGAIVDLLDSFRPLEGLRLLDLATGSGRIARAAASRGASVAGLDLSPHLLEMAKVKAPRLPLVRGDMRWLPLADASLHGVLLIFTSFGYFQEDGQNLQVLDEVCRVLGSGGFFLLDLLNPTWIRSHLVPESVRREGDLEIFERRSLEECGTRLVKKVDVRNAVEGWSEEWEENLRLYEADRIRDELTARSLEMTRMWGDYEGSPWGRRTPRMILLAEKEGGSA